MNVSGPLHPLDVPLQFEPFFRPQVWGGRQLQEHFGKPLPARVAVGESWEVSAQPLHVSRVLSGPWQGHSLSELWNSHRKDLLGDQQFDGPQFPWLIKWLDCTDRFSVQVHPNDAQARMLLREPTGKTESWVVVHAEPSAMIYAGLKADVTRDELERHLIDGTVTECLHSFTPRAGDAVHIPAGTVHAVSGGVLMAEVQQTSDATFRLFDWNRVDAQGKSRSLHPEQALDSIDFERGPIHPIRALTPADAPGEFSRELLASCPYYALERFTVSEAMAIPPEGITAWILFSGAARLGTTDDRFHNPMRSGDVVLVPACAGSIFWEPAGPESAVLLRVKLP